MFLGAQLTLFFNDTDHPELKEGQPAFFLETTARQVLFEEPTGFLNEHYVHSASTASSHTWSKAAYSLKSWFQYLQAIGHEWLTASEQERRDYRDAYLSSISPKTGKLYGPDGVRDTMVVVRSFYEYCSKTGIYQGDIGGILHVEERRVPMGQDAFAHTRHFIQTRIKDRALPKTKPSGKVHPLRVVDLRNLLRYIGPQAGERRGDQRPSRDRLVLDLGWAVGLRLDEINRLTTLQFLGVCPDPSTPFVSMSLTIHRGKGNKTRQVAIPTWLVMDAIAYIEGERAESLRSVKEKSRYPSHRLLLAHINSRSCGRPITNGALQKVIRTACFELGLVDTIEKKDPITGEIFLDRVPKHSIHDLRHSYAVLTYHAERLNGNSEPWKKIQAQLGHENLKTTIDTYLRHVEIFNDQPGMTDVRRMLGL